MDFRTEKAWMVRDDGESFPCVCHIYGCYDDVEETLYATQWLYIHTKNEQTKKKCIKFFKTYGASLSKHRNSVRSILLKIKETDYNFLDYKFIFNLTDEINNTPAGDLFTLNEQIIHSLNNEFMRVRYGGMYDSDDDNRDLYFRLSNSGLLTPKWKNIIEKIITENTKFIDKTIIVSDLESTGECKILW